MDVESLVADQDSDNFPGDTVNIDKRLEMDTG